MMEKKSPFLDTLFLLRKEGTLTIFSDFKTLSEKEEKEAEDFFESEFEKERLDFLSDKIPFNKEAAIWAAKVLYHSAQLYLIRKDTAKDLEKLIPQYQDEKDVSAILSADLSFRFLPKLLDALQIADSTDPLVKILENILQQFHYSGIGLDLNFEKINWEEELKNKTYRKLYLERIVEKKAYKLAEIPYINQLLIAEFGMYKDIFWRELKIIEN
ncbi:Uncharacterised protein [Chryseobacterium indoltheticum]|uniref:MoxR-vWA-beta-propeller ternary system domain-containing protein n=2 Tax=Chryseobacterium indoltheticum TaxID=254 RepID=A0A381FIX0_9FLAO|nr:Uncharacterised protein [Chryseobacterium indoltheticum]